MPHRRRVSLPPVWAILAGMLFAPGLLHAEDEATIVAKLNTLGGEVTTRSDGSVDKVKFDNAAKLGENEYRLIGGLKKLRYLQLWRDAFGLTDAAFSHLSGLESLEEMIVDKIQLTDEGFRHFKKLVGLKKVVLYEPGQRQGLKGFAGTGFSNLKDLPELRYLGVGGAPLGDDFLKQVASLEQLEELGVWHTALGPESMAILGKMHHLRSLRVGQRARVWTGPNPPPSLTDATLPLLATAGSVETLRLDDARLSHAGLSALRRMPELRTLILEKVDLPAGDMEKLRADLPHVVIQWKPLTPEDFKRLDTILGPPPKEEPAGK